MNDGDKGLVVQDEIIINVAKRDCEGVVPLYYEMLKAKDELLTSENIYIALTSAYKANIGIISNEITKIWNTENPNVDAVKWLCMYSNFVIDYAKTLYLPDKPSHVDEELKRFSKMKLPHFFKYAKDKEDKQVNEINNCTVNMLENIIPNKPIQFKKIVGDCDYKMLMKNFNVRNNKNIIDTFIDINRRKGTMTKFQGYNDEGFIKHMKDTMSNISTDDSYVVDVLVKHFFKTNSSFKKTLWDCYGDIILENILLNVGESKCCEKCSERFDGKKNEKLCITCKKEKKKEQDRLAYLKFQEKLKR